MAVVVVVPGVGSSQAVQADLAFDEGMNSLVGNLGCAVLEMSSVNPGGGVPFLGPGERQFHMPEGLERLSTVLRPITQSTLFATKPKITTHATRANGPLAAQQHDSNAPGWQCCRPSARLPWCVGRMMQSVQGTYRGRRNLNRASP